MKLFAITLIVLLFFSCSTKTPKVYQWRGENRQGIFPEENLLKTWTEDGPNEIWFLDGIGNGYGTPTITDSEIFITGEIHSIATLFCINFEGEILWKSTFGNEWTKSFPGSRSAPTVVDDLIYVGSGMGNLFCLKRKSGEIVWSKEFTTDFDGIYPRFGHSEAALVDGDKVLWTPGGKKYNVVGLNRFTGEIIWSNSGHSERSAYNPGALIKLPNRNIFVTFSAYNMMGFDTETGELLWTHAQDNTTIEERKPGIGDTHCNSVLFDNGAIYYAAGDGNGGVKLQLSEDGTKITEVWRNKGFDSYMGAIVKIGDYLYGSATAKKELRSINANSGILSDSLKLGWGAIIAADNMLYYYRQNGKLSLLSYDNGKITQQSEFKITRGTKEHFSHPVIKYGILYQRRGNTLMAFDIRESNYLTSANTKDLEFSVETLTLPSSMESIKYMDRKSGQQKTEYVPGEGMLKWLYNTTPGKVALNVLLKRKVISTLSGWFMDSRLSAGRVQEFVTQNKINLDEYQISDVKDFHTFNQFFYRKLKPDARAIGQNIVSPADGRVLVFQSLKNISKFFIKGSEFTINNFLQDKELAQKYKDGAMLIVRLAPADYHRFHFPANGKISVSKQIKGHYFSVSPLALKKSLEIFCQNIREYSILSTPNHGDILISEVGATMVGGITQTYISDSEIKKGAEKGYFSFGGSTLVLLFEKDKISFDPDLIQNTNKGFETAIKMGETIGK